MAAGKLLQDAQTITAIKNKTVPIVGGPERPPESTNLNVSVCDYSSVVVLAKKHTARCARLVACLASWLPEVFGASAL